MTSPISTPAAPAKDVGNSLGAPYDMGADNIIQHPARFNFTYALMGGAWLEDSKGNRNWYSFTLIQAVHGQQWIERHLAKQGWMTGCWVECETF